MSQGDIQMEILEHGTIKTITDFIGANHQNV